MYFDVLSMMTVCSGARQKSLAGDARVRGADAAYGIGDAVAVSCAAVAGGVLLPGPAFAISARELLSIEPCPHSLRRLFVSPGRTDA